MDSENKIIYFLIWSTIHRKVRLIRNKLIVEKGSYLVNNRVIPDPNKSNDKTSSNRINNFEFNIVENQPPTAIEKLQAEFKQPTTSSEAVAMNSIWMILKTLQPKK
jgi:hypothetical protein